MIQLSVIYCLVYDVLPNGSVFELLIYVLLTRRKYYALNYCNVCVL